MLAQRQDDGVAICGAGEGRFFVHPDTGVYS
jgi:hypothetical protein